MRTHDGPTSCREVHSVHPLRRILRTVTLAGSEITVIDGTGNKKVPGVARYRRARSQITVINP